MFPGSSWTPSNSTRPVTRRSISGTGGRRRIDSHTTASKNGKASRILEKGKEHFERARRSHSEGQASRAEVEMDLALKLAAKAVDIARSGPR